MINLTTQSFELDAPSIADSSASAQVHLSILEYPLFILFLIVVGYVLFFRLRQKKLKKSLLIIWSILTLGLVGYYIPYAIEEIKSNKQYVLNEKFGGFELWLYDNAVPYKIKEKVAKDFIKKNGVTSEQLYYLYEDEDMDVPRGYLDDMNSKIIEIIPEIELGELFRDRDLNYTYLRQIFLDSNLKDVPYSKMPWSVLKKSIKQEMSIYETKKIGKSGDETLYTVIYKLGKIFETDYGYYIKCEATVTKEGTKLLIVDSDYSYSSL